MQYFLCIYKCIQDVTVKQISDLCTNLFFNMDIILN